MPFKLLLSEKITPAIRRMAVEQLTRAKKELQAGDNLQTGVHETRKCLKRVRSLVRLSKPIIGKHVFRAENHCYRDVARALARPREAGARLETIIRFEDRKEFARFEPLLLATKKLILSEKSSREAELELVALSSITDRLDKAIKRWKKMSLPDAGFGELAHGFAMSYTKGRESLIVAIEKEETFYLHEWRKDVQQCWRHMQMLTLIWPEDIMPRIKLAREISRLLGLEHDLDDVLIFIKAHKKQLRQDTEIKALLKPFSKTVKAMQSELCLHAVERGRRLYAMEPLALADAMTIYWKTGRALQPLPSFVLDIAKDTPPKRAHHRPTKRPQNTEGSSHFEGRARLRRPPRG